MGSSSTAARPAPRVRTSRPTAPGSTTTTSPRALAWPSGTSPRPHPRGYVWGYVTRKEGSGLGGRWTGRPTNGGSPGTTSRPVRRRAGCVATSRACGSSRSWSTVRRPGRWPPRCTRRSPPRTTPPRTRPRPRSSAGSPSTPPPGSGLEAGRCRFRSSSSRLPSCGTTRAGPATRTAISTCRSTRACSPPARGEGCTRSASWTASRRSTGSGTPQSCATPSSAGCSPRTGTRSTPRPARSLSSRRTPGRSAPAPRRSLATSTATRPSGAASILTRSPARRCGGPGTVGRGLRPDPTRSCPRAEPSSGSDGSTSCTSSASLPRLSEWSTVPSRSAGSSGTRWSTWCSRGWARVARAGTPPTSAARSSGSSPPSTSWRTAPVRHELVEDLTDRTVARCVPLLARDDVPEHVRSLTSRAGARCRSRLGRPTHVTRRAALDALIRSAPWSRGVASTTPNARSSPHSAAPPSSW